MSRRMRYRRLGRTGFEVSSIGFGAWAIGGTWGAVDDVQSLATLHRALDMLTGKLERDTRFDSDDHRSFNRDGAAFDKGETFSGFDYERSLQVVDKLRALAPAGSDLTELALRYVLSFPSVTCAIPGARKPTQVEHNVKASDAPVLDEALLAALSDLYAADVKPFVHQRW
jgi:aryl-alcohol dehydrogenase-like predicted oxidoreductase